MKQTWKKFFILDTRWSDFEDLCSLLLEVCTQQLNKNKCRRTNLFIRRLPSGLLLACPFLLLLGSGLARRDLLALRLLHPLLVPLADRRQDLRRLVLALRREHVGKALGFYFYLFTVKVRVTSH